MRVHGGQSGAARRVQDEPTVLLWLDTRSKCLTLSRR